MIELKTTQQARDFIQGDNFQPAAYRDLDLTDFTKEILDRDFGASLFLGCELEGEAICHLAQGGAYLIHDMDGFSFPVHRARLYTPEELFHGLEMGRFSSRYDTLDHKIFEEYLQSGREQGDSIKVTLARRLHDHSITQALYPELEGREVAAIMGGHGLERASAEYRKVAQIARRLTAEGFLLVSGGGPGAMEACHLGAFFATRSEDVMLEAIDAMSIRPENGKPGKEYADEDWLHRAWRVRQDYPVPQGDEEKCKSIGIPTWTYGHEPPAVFATHIAKYFANSVREDGLLLIATHGVIFAPGSAGTIQEIFQDACQNHYLVAEGQCSPMILLGRDYWTRTKPVWSLLSKLAEEQPYGELLCLTDSIDTVVRRLLCYRPDLYTFS